MDWIETTRKLLSTRYVGRQIEAHQTIGSTNERALAWLDAPEGAVVVADAQSAGRGRLGRHWQGGEGESLLFSVLLRPAAGGELGLIPLTAGLAVTDALEGVVQGSGRLALKWPNDILVDRRKCAGILVESTMMAQASSSGHKERGEDPALRAVVGVGLNVNQESFLPTLRETATSLRLATGHIVPRPVLLAEILNSIEMRFAQLASDPDRILAEYRSRLSGVGSAVTVTGPGGNTTRGVLDGVEPTGALRVRTEEGTTSFTAGVVTLRKP